jgi:hypothetical protein
VNIIFSKNGNPQTVDISSITQSTCYQSIGMNGARLTVSTVDCSSTATENPENRLEILIYPQPAKDRFRIELPNVADQNNYHLSILDLNGREVRRTSFTGNSVLIERGILNSGLYILHIIGDNSGLEFNSKLSLK